MRAQQADVGLQSLLVETQTCLVSRPCSPARSIAWILEIDSYRGYIILDDRPVTTTTENH